jgi:hypothetical protein
MGMRAHLVGGHRQELGEVGVEPAFRRHEIQGLKAVRHVARAGTARIGRAFADGFAPQLTPAQMLELGVFGGKYMGFRPAGSRARSPARRTTIHD